MKISPVQGTPTIPQPSNSGVSPEKLERLKAIASGQAPKEEEQEVIPQKSPVSTQKIVMQTNKTPEQGLAQAIVDAGSDASDKVVAENAVSDTGVQTTSAEAVQPISPQLAALAKAKRALQVKERELAEKEKALNADNGWAEREKRIKSGQALSVLQELGVTYDQLTNEILGKQANGNVDALNSKIASLEKSIDEKLAAKDTAQEQAVFDHMKRNVDKLTFSSDEYKFIRESKSQDDVLELIRRTWKDSGEVLDEEEAMKLIETELREDARRYVKLISELEPTTPAPVQPAPQGIKTLTNKDSARPNASRRQRAIAAMLGQK